MQIDPSVAELEREADAGSLDIKAGLIAPYGYGKGLTWNASQSQRTSPTSATPPASEKNKYS